MTRWRKARPALPAAVEHVTFGLPRLQPCAAPDLPDELVQRVALSAPILTLDLGQELGWALRWDREHLASGVEPLGDERTGLRLVRFREWLRDMLEVTGAVLVGYTQPFVLRERRTGISFPHSLEGVLLVELEGNVDYVAPRSSDVAKHCVRRRTADPTRLACAASERFGKEVTREEEARALCVLAWVLDVLGEPRG